MGHRLSHTATDAGTMRVGHALSGGAELRHSVESHWSVVIYPPPEGATWSNWSQAKPSWAQLKADVGGGYGH